MKTSTLKKTNPASHGRLHAQAPRTVGELRDEADALAQRSQILNEIVVDLETRFGWREGEPEKLKVAGTLTRVRREVLGQIVAEIRAASVAAWQERMRLEKTHVSTVVPVELPRLFEK